ncbi:MAG: hypothetical protein PHE87_07320 [Victivallaceae bacterium]|nr:hypothetical protein [Victivallaceae bacterium]
MKLIIFTFAILLLVSTCFASGWNDFTLDIGDGYNIFRANSMDVCIGRTGGSLILYPRNYEKVGPVIRYITTPNHILTKNLGKKSRNLLEGDSFQEIDSTMEFFFIISKKSTDIRGPFTKEEFSRLPEVAAIGSLDWQTPRNPNFWLPLLGSLMILSFFIPVLVIKYFWITIPLILGTFLILHRIKKRKKKVQQ